MIDVPFLAFTAALNGLILTAITFGLRRMLRESVPGSDPTGTPQFPRRYVIGRPRPGARSLRAPLSDRTCAAWKLTIQAQGFGPERKLWHKYSGVNFEISTNQGTVPIRLGAAHEEVSSGWVIPDEHVSEQFVVTVRHEAPEVPFDRRLSLEQRKRAGERAVAEVRECRFPPHLLRNVRVIETIVDFDQQWACEGPYRDFPAESAISEDGPFREVADAPGDTNLAIGVPLPETEQHVFELPVKLAPASELLGIWWGHVQIALIFILIMITGYDLLCLAFTA